MTADPATPNTAPYGSWASPFTVEMITEGGVGIGSVLLDRRDDGTHELWWSESRPTEGGRIALTCVGLGSSSATAGHPTGAEPHDVLHLGWSARTRVHEYGGGAWWLHDGVLFFSNWDDQRLYRFEPGDHPQPITAVPTVPHGDRYADGVVTPDGAFVICVRERHRPEGEPKNEIVAIPADGSGEPSVLVSGPDFVSSPRLDRTGRRLAWLQWNHPAMPWDGTELWMAVLSFDVAASTGTGSESFGNADPGRSKDATPTLNETTLVAGGATESVMEPRWGVDGALWFISDRSEWWNLYRLSSADPEQDRSTVGDRAEPIAPRPAEIGGPAWTFGASSYALDDEGRAVFSWARSGQAFLGLAEPDGSTVRSVATGLSSASSIQVSGDLVAFLGAGPTEPAAVRTVSLQTLAEAPPESSETTPRVETTLIHASRVLDVDPAEFSVAEPITFASGPGGERLAHAYLYRPTNAAWAGPEEERPPLIVLGHGGPTSAASAVLALGVQFWTSRGFAVVDVNYGGSTGFGRTYRRLLDNAWGIVDVEDCVAAAQHLVAEGIVDERRLAIAGGSAGGFTVLCALTFHDTFTAGASHYGVADLRALAEETHKFESRYLDGLIGPWPEAADRYVERSPISHTDRLSCPLIVLQGLEDEIVPPSQARLMVEALAAKGVPHAYVEFEGEQHGFRKAENIVRALESEFSFYAQIFGFEPADRIAPVPIAHLD